MKAGFLAKQFHYSMIIFGLVNFYLTHAQAQDSHAHVLNSQQHQVATGNKTRRVP